LIIVLGAFLRFYKLDTVPASLNWDEVAAGYNAYTIANWGADEYGNKFPIVFKSFGDDKHPVHIYLTALVIKIFGLSDFSTRAGSALVGTLGILVIYFLAKKLFKSELAGIFSALFLAISPYHLQFSRGLWEANFAFFFFVLGLMFFYMAVDKNKWFFPLSFVSFGLSMYSYHSSKIVVPPMIILLCILYFKDLIKSKKVLLVNLLVLAIFIAGFIINPRLLGFARAEQNQFPDEKLKATNLYKKTGNKYLATLEIAAGNYTKYFSPDYLFINGDQNPRNSVKVFGEFYKIDALLILLGIIFMMIKPRKEWLVLLSWVLIAPAPGALSGFTPNAARGLFMMGGLHLIAAYGLVGLVDLFKNKIVKVTLVILFLIPIAWEFSKYINYYYKVYAKKDAIEWQYGMKQSVLYLKRNPDYVRVFVDKIRQQPYIFFLYYFKTPLPELLKTVRYDESESKSYNTVVSFGDYQFGGEWDIINSQPYPGLIYIVTPSYYSGLRYINQFDVKKLVKYPNGNDAFYIIEGNI
jgi:4-amino-4-deoxy-L-arabinose transferase-like glycosyltransferase